MAEKGEGTGDSVSLPPTYAASDTYTDSPPPAYKGGREGKAVQVVKLLCVTAVVIALLTGFFVLSSNYLKSQSCSCGPRPLDSEEARTALLQAGFLQPPPPPQAQPLVGEERKDVIKNVEEEEEERNTLDAGDDATLGQMDANDQMDALMEEVMEAEHQLEKDLQEVEEEEEEALQDILRAQADHMKKIRLPVDLILGNPSLAGREVSCEVERRQVPLAPGIMSQTILVTCSDDNNDDITSKDTPKEAPKDTPRPPMSLLAPLMKMLTSRPGPQPRLVPVIRGAMPIMSQSRPLKQVSMRGPFPLPLPSKPRPSGVPVRGPVSVIMPRPSVDDAPTDRMLPRHLQPVVRLSPRLLSRPREEQNALSLLGLQRGAVTLPQARPRAPIRPVSLSPFPPRPAPAFLPFSVLGDAPRRPATHMEIKDQDTAPPTRDFGPPRGHTLIAPPPAADTPPRPPPRLVTLPKAIRVHTLPPSPHQPPSFAPEGRRAPLPPPLNPEAEVLQLPQGDGPPLPPLPPSRHHASAPLPPPLTPSDPSPPRHHLVRVH